MFTDFLSFQVRKSVNKTKVSCIYPEDGVYLLRKVIVGEIGTKKLEMPRIAASLGQGFG